ncbi:hypothetical protein K438DRAFT_194707 [Mycena galopus ATCC 62051]|nr:hypothetical protein K438DRAFT_194707 [Mycena galopus ATCC 62051]
MRCFTDVTHSNPSLLSRSCLPHNLVADNHSFDGRPVSILIFISPGVSLASFRCSTVCFTASRSSKRLALFRTRLRLTHKDESTRPAAELDDASDLVSFSPSPFCFLYLFSCALSRRAIAQYASLVHACSMSLVRWAHVPPYAYVDAGWSFWEEGSWFNTMASSTFGKIKGLKGFALCAQRATLHPILVLHFPCFFTLSSVPSFVSAPFSTSHTDPTALPAALNSAHDRPIHPVNGDLQLDRRRYVSSSLLSSLLLFLFLSILGLGPSFFS